MQEDSKETRFVKVENKNTELIFEKRTEIDLAVYTTIKSFMNKNTRKAYPNIKTISNILGVSSPTTIKSIKRLIEIGDITVTKSKNNKSTYYFPKEEGHWKPIDFDFIKITPNKLSAMEKGFIIMMRKLLYSNTNYIHKNGTIIANDLGISYPTFIKRIQRLEEKEFLKHELALDDVYNYVGKFKIIFNMEKLHLRLDKIEQDVAETKAEVHNIKATISKIKEESAAYMTKDEFKKEMANFLKEIKSGK